MELKGWGITRNHSIKCCRRDNKTNTTKLPIIIPIILMLDHLIPSDRIEIDLISTIAAQKLIYCLWSRVKDRNFRIKWSGSLLISMLSIPEGSPDIPTKAIEICSSHSMTRSARDLWIMGRLIILLLRKKWSVAKKEGEIQSSKSQNSLKIQICLAISKTQIDSDNSNNQTNLSTPKIQIGSDI